MTAKTRIESAVTVALEAIHDAAPGLLTLTEVAEKVASHADVTVSTARNYLRAAVEAGDLLELTPWSRKFIIELPGADVAGLGPFYVAQEWAGSGRDHRRVITSDDEKARPSSYGPGRTTYVADPEQIREYVQKLADEKKAKEEAEREAHKAEEKAQNREIVRRFPGLNRTLRKVMFLGRNTRDAVSRMELIEGDARLSDHRVGDKDISEWRVQLDVRAWGDANVAVLKSILEAGVVAHIQAQPLIVCKHCDRRILHTVYGRDEFWWHVDTSNASCGKDRDTKAEPVEGADVPRETSG
jgi:hypothetical protein